MTLSSSEILIITAPIVGTAAVVLMGWHNYRAALKERAKRRAEQLKFVSLDGDDLNDLVAQFGEAETEQGGLGATAETLRATAARNLVGALTPSSNAAGARSFEAAAGNELVLSSIEEAAGNRAFFKLSQSEQRVIRELRRAARDNTTRAPSRSATTGEF
jgi:hypothetical protein